MSFSSSFLLFLLLLALTSASRFAPSVSLAGGEPGGRAKRDGSAGRPVSAQLARLRSDFTAYWGPGLALGCAPGDNDCCSGERPCADGDGDCDPGQGQCAVGTRCVEDNCRSLHEGEENWGGYSATDDCCELRPRCLGDNPECCSFDVPCILDEGPCSGDEDCASDLVCGKCGAHNPYFGEDDNCCVFKCENIQGLGEQERRGIPCR